MRGHSHTIFLLYRPVDSDNQSEISAVAFVYIDCGLEKCAASDLIYITFVNSSRLLFYFFYSNYEGSSRDVGNVK
jgi:hypothetical protein